MGKMARRAEIKAGAGKLRYWKTLPFDRNSKSPLDFYLQSIILSVL
jgi:hypothetical protein